MPATLWDSYYKGPNITLSGGSLVASSSLSSTNSVLGTRTLTQKSYWEITATALSTTMSIGVANRLANTSNLFDANSNGLGFRQNGNVTLNNATVTTIQTYTTGNVVQVAVDPPNRLAWFNVNNGNWNNNAANSPATGVGGIDISGLAFWPILPAWGYSNAGTSTGTAAFSSAGWSFSAPSGFSSPDTTNPLVYSADRQIGGSVLTVTASILVPNTVTAQRCSLPKAENGFYGTNRFLPQWSPGATPVTISGYTSENGVAKSLTVRLYNKTTGDFIAQTQSSAVDGSYAFYYLNPAITYDVVCFDTGFDGLIHDAVSGT